MKKLILIILINLICTSCGINRESLNEHVEQSIIEKTESEGKHMEVIDDLVLTNTEGNNYSGRLTCVIDGDTTELVVQVVYDGETYQAQWGTPGQMAIRKLFGL